VTITTAIPAAECQCQKGKYSKEDDEHGHHKTISNCRFKKTKKQTIHHREIRQDF
jgi:hypothetical protein